LTFWPSKRDFLDALVGEAGDFDQHVLKGPRDLFAAGVGHHAVAAVFGAAFHDAHEGAGALDARRRQVVEFFDLGKADVDLRLAQPGAVGQQLRQAVQRLRAEHHIDIRRALDDGRAFLAGHAAAHADQHAFFLQVLDAAQVAEDFFLCFFAHGAGVEEDQVGLLHVQRRLVALGGMEHVGHLVRVVLVHLAAEGFDKDFFAHDVLSGLNVGGSGGEGKTGLLLI
jgi:hypothetical protein